MRYDIDWTTMENYSIVATYLPNASWSVKPCDHGWEYETSEITSSIVIDVRLSNCTEKIISTAYRTLQRICNEINL